MHLALLAQSFPQEYTKMRIYFETCFTGESKYYAHMKADRLASLCKLHAEAAILYMELGRPADAIESLEHILTLYSEYDNGNTGIMADIVERLQMIYTAEY